MKKDTAIIIMPIHNNIHTIQDIRTYIHMYNYIQASILVMDCKHFFI